MDIFNKNKVKELETKIEGLEDRLNAYKEREQKRNSKKHATGAWCTGCKNLVTCNTITYPFVTQRFCILDNECADRKA